MSRFLESIKVKNRRFFNLQYHQIRVEHTLHAHYGKDVNIDLSQCLQIPESLNDGLYKCRVEYDTWIGKIEFLPYLPKTIQTLKLMEASELSYDFKLLDRKFINQLFEQKGNFDDVLFVKDGLITDTSYCNILFFDGENWITPEMPLLAGTKRQQLLDEGRIKPRKIAVGDLHQFESIMLINAMLDFDEERCFLVSNINR